MKDDAQKVDMTTIPNAARIYDYMLDGIHHYEADRQAAGFMLSLIPSTKKWVQLLRRYMNLTVRQLAGEGFDRFLDLASGLPTADHIHSTIPDANVIYIDNDPLVATIGANIIGEHGNARYLEADIRDIAAILDSRVVRDAFGDGRKVAIGLNAITCFLTHDEIRKLMVALYEWAPLNSKLFATFETRNPTMMTPQMQQFLAAFDQMGSPYHFLTLQESMALVAPWTVDEMGFRPLAEVLGVEAEMTEADREGVELEFYGAVFTKQ
ncbi:MAG: SAM-dependent methyltransferase [Deltaproteobacteria bacterium]|nr:SAM-dependent methyltransferase [Deltaproteobacteria bacterium]